MIKGKVTTGFGKGSHFLPLYNALFEEKLGFSCYPGTLNLLVEKIPTFLSFKAIRLQPNSTVGIVDCYPVKINKEIKGAIVIPMKTRHAATIVEVVAPVCLRDYFKLHDGDEVTCELV